MCLCQLYGTRLEKELDRELENQEKVLLMFSFVKLYCNSDRRLIHLLYQHMEFWEVEASL